MLYVLTSLTTESSQRAVSSEAALLRLGLPSGSCAVSMKARCLRHRVEGRHVTPEWELWRNLKFPGGNVCGMRQLQPMPAKRLAFTGCCG